MNYTEKEKEILRMLKRYKSLDDDMKTAIICKNCDCTPEEIEKVKRMEELRKC